MILLNIAKKMVTTPKMLGFTLKSLQANKLFILTHFWIKRKSDTLVFAGIIIWVLTKHGCLPPDAM